MLTPSSVTDPSLFREKQTQRAVKRCILADAFEDKRGVSKSATMGQLCAEQTEARVKITHKTCDSCLSG